MFVQSGYGLCCDPGDPDSIASALYWFFEHPAETQAMGARGRQQVVAEWNYERRFAPVLAYMAKSSSVQGCVARWTPIAPGKARRWLG